MGQGPLKKILFKTSLNDLIYYYDVTLFQSPKPSKSSKD